MVRVVPNGKGGRQNAKHKERLRSGLIRDIVFDGVRQEVLDLRIDLRSNQAQKHQRIRLGVYGPEIGCHGKLKGINGAHCNVLCFFDTKDHGKRLQTQLPVPLDALEIVDDGDAQSSYGVHQSENNDFQRQFTKEALSGPPGECDVGGAEGIGPLPSVLFQLERRGGIDVADERSKQRDGCQCREIVSDIVVQVQRQTPTTEHQEQGLHQHILAGDSS
eukprot:scaffold207_cov345-Pavlova_lutheri.AAC.31